MRLLLLKIVAAPFQLAGFLLVLIPIAVFTACFGGFRAGTRDAWKVVNRAQKWADEEISKKKGKPDAE